MQVTEEEKILLARGEDTVRLASKQYSVKTLGFLTPAEAVFLGKNIKAPLDVKIMFYGGYEECERTLFIAMPEFFEEEYKEEISVLEITGRNINELSHRDFLGSLMGLGVERKTVGDILVYEDRAYVFILKDMEDYILENVDKIGRHGVKIRSVMPDELVLPEKKTEEITGPVSTPRLDAVVALCTRLSRGKASELIETEKVSVNWEVKNHISTMLNEGDLLSVRGYGRFKLDKINGLSRKGRTHITIQKYI